MQKLTDIGEKFVNEIASRYGLSHDAVLHMLVAVNNGGGSMAQFNCPELGGSGQWMRGGMIMVGDMFNNGLKNTVDNLCNELANILSNNQVFPVVPAGTPGSNQWWPSDLGSPFSSGGQNNSRYAVFANRLAVEVDGQLSIYDTLDHNIGGVSQQQGSNDSLTFNSQWGTISVTSLPLVSGQPIEPVGQTNFVEPTHFEEQMPEPAFMEPEFQAQAPVNNIQTEPQTQPNNNNAQYEATSQMIEVIKKLAELRDLGVLTEEEFNKKKSEILN
ncbi:SHOCT domain-containing protein [Psychromonas sp. KJ10-10]|uniref:SHOCT domain-containing protein n=1 Tax=Psychromonas sp. KJ10-10 TaxID=3391823 RepID=UPI0039B553DA